MEHSWTVKQIKNYVESRDSLGDVMYYMTDENIDKANIEWEEGDLENDDPDERMREYIMHGTSPMGKKYTGTGTYIHDDFEGVTDIEEA
jgi:hypothetical protein